MPGKRQYTTPHACIPLINPRRNVPSDRDQCIRARLRQTAVNNFHVDFQGPIYLSIGPEALHDLYNTFDLTKPYKFSVDPPSSENPPLCKIDQEGKPTIVTTDFYFTNMKPKHIIQPTPETQKDMSSDNTAAASLDKPKLFINTDQLQPGEIQLHS